MQLTPPSKTRNRQTGLDVASRLPSRLTLRLVWVSRLGRALVFRGSEAKLSLTLFFESVYSALTRKTIGGTLTMNVNPGGALGGIKMPKSIEKCPGQGKSFKATQTIFKPLNGIGNEEEMYSLMQHFNSGVIGKEEFDAEARAKEEKVFVAAPDVGYFGHILATDRLKPDPEKVRAITSMKVPTNKAEVMIGMVN
ncbi:ATP binding [Branchiostoma belcheri]|nr:ATP binding [Branchiostoma belcheri]